MSEYEVAIGKTIGRAVNPFIGMRIEWGDDDETAAFHTGTITAFGRDGAFVRWDKPFGKANREVSAITWDNVRALIDTNIVGTMAVESADSKPATKTSTAFDQTKFDAMGHLKYIQDEVERVARLGKGIDAICDKVDANTEDASLPGNDTWAVVSIAGRIDHDLEALGKYVLNCRKELAAKDARKGGEAA